MVFAGVFLVVQFLLLIDGAYSWNDAWVIKDERKWWGKKTYRVKKGGLNITRWQSTVSLFRLIYLLICSGIFFTLSLIAIYFEFVSLYTILNWDNGICEIFLSSNQLGTLHIRYKLWSKHHIYHFHDPSCSNLCFNNDCGLRNSAKLPNFSGFEPL